MTQEHPITPPPELLVQEWLCDDNYPCDSYTNATISIAAGRLRNIATQAARWGADQERLRAARRRPKLPSLKEQAKEALGRFFANEHTQASQMTRDFEIIRRALESLPDV